MYTVIILSFTYKDIIESSIKVFECINYGDENYEQNRLIKDNSVRCSGHNYKTWSIVIALPILLVVGIVYPLISFIYLPIEKRTPFNLPSEEEIQA